MRDPGVQGVLMHPKPEVFYKHSGAWQGREGGDFGHLPPQSHRGGEARV